MACESEQQALNEAQANLASAEAAQFLAYWNWVGSQAIADLDQSIYEATRNNVMYWVWMVAEAQAALDACEMNPGGRMRVATTGRGNPAGALLAGLRDARECVRKAMS